MKCTNEPFSVQLVFSYVELKLLELLISVLDIPGFLGKNLAKTLTKKSTNFQDLVRSCKEIQEIP